MLEMLATPRAAQGAALWSLAIYNFVFRDSAPKARYQNSQPRVSEEPVSARSATLGKRKKKASAESATEGLINAKDPRSVA